MSMNFWATCANEKVYHFDYYANESLSHFIYKRRETCDLSFIYLDLLLLLDIIFALRIVMWMLEIEI